MIGLGTIINVGAIIIGGLCGLFMGKAVKVRYQDMQMLCNKYNDYDNVKLLDYRDFTGNFEYKDGVFSPKRTKSQDVKIHVVDVFGNGYEGNKYVYKDYMYTQDTLDTSVRENIIDGKATSYYEYSRITVQNNVEETNSK